MNCYACDQEATHRCSRCGNAYCHDHGEAPPGEGQAPSPGSLAGPAGQPLCADCLDPVNAAPSGVVFRASVFALLVASVLALWLIVRPPSLPGESSEVLKPQPSAGAATASPGVSPRATASPGASATATPAPSASAAPEPTPVQYTVVDGDTLYGIADAFGVSAEDLAAVNGLDIEDPVLHPGDKLVIPR
ncbi:MAG: LysM peptidoglycan-binding domain-containing protein [Chloroflexi bacterium]|nr:LysM peptidoglycan-binding domain-containing protein [Chloroflexota bacterium]